MKNLKEMSTAKLIGERLMREGVITQAMREGRPEDAIALNRSLETILEELAQRGAFESMEADRAIS